MTPRVLVLRALGLGDFLAGVPALRALGRATPGHRLVLAAPEALRPLVALSGAVDELLVTDELQPVPWSGSPPDVAVDLHGNGPASRRLLEALDPRRLVAFAGHDDQGRRFHGPVWDPEEHERRRWCRLVEEAFGVGADADDLRLAVPDRASRAPGAVVIHVGAASLSRRWPEERFAAVARAVAAAGVPVVLTGSGPERPAMERVRAAAGLSAGALLEHLSLQDLAAVMVDARLVVCGDTGVAHLASAYRTPSVVLFGPTPPRRWGPPADGPHDVIWHGTGLGDPHGLEADPALLRITQEEVIARVRVRLAQSPADRRRPAARRSTAPST
jgi:ADP-heptose:LPS heptosyltransferase